ncbi:MAG: outer membrane beta-barrel protein [Cyanobacteria bacterium P01_G01_bin.19]
MFKSISNCNLWTIAQNATLAVAVVLGFSLSAKAEDNKTYKTLEVSCNPFTTGELAAECNSDLGIQSETQLIAQRRGRSRKSKVDGYYAGATLGAFFPSDLDDILEADTGFGGSFFGGVKFNKYFSADIEVFGASGDFEDIPIPGGSDIESTYSGFGLYINPKAELPVFKLAGSAASVYISPGIGVSVSNVEVDFGDNIADDDVVLFSQETDATQTSISFQIKGGVKVPVSKNISVIGQLRYVSLPTEDFLVDDNLNFFSTEAGVSFNF